MDSIFFSLLGIFCLVSLFFHAVYVLARVGIRDVPNERSLHTEITKKSGGVIFISLFVVFLLVWKYLSLGSKSAFVYPMIPDMHIKMLILGCAFFGLLGLFDDLYSLSPNIRLFLEFSFSFCWIFFLSPQVGLFGHTVQNTGILIFLLGFMMVFVVNLVNFMDGLDLHLIGTILISCIFWGPIFSSLFLPAGSFFSVLVCLFLALFGFIYFNFPKAKLFMGDSGSLTLGFILIALPLLANNEFNSTFAILKFFFLFPVFWIDGILTILIRAFQKKHIFQAHRDHLYQILTETKLGKVGSCLVVCLANLPAYFIYLAHQSNHFKTSISVDYVIVLTVVGYIFVYSMVRLWLFRSRKNLAERFAE